VAPPTRRAVLAAGVLAAVVRSRRVAAAALAAEEVAPGLVIVPRSTWAPDLAPVGPIPDEPDVRFLLVHHSVDRNDYSPAGAVDALRAIHRFHTSPDKGWPDIAYNFFVDRFGTVYEGRAGSLAGPTAGDATGGSQGFAQLCCFLGDHRDVPPSPQAVASMGRLLGWLAARSGVSVAPGATATFVSRGSNRHPAGTTVTTPTIAGHRDMSATACPGDAAYALVADGTFAALARGAAAAQPSATTTSAAPPPPTAATPAPATAPSSTTISAAAPAAPSDDRRPELAVGGGAALAAVAAVLALRRRR